MSQYPDNQGGPRAGEVEGDNPPQHIARPALPLTIEGPRAEIAEEINQLSPEGSPADAKVGPGLLAAEVGLAVLIFTAMAVGLGLWLGWTAGIAIFAIGMAALLFNPAAIAALLRMKERKVVADRHNEPPVKVVRAVDVERRAT